MDSLEVDTGLVTEQISEGVTLLAADVVVEKKPVRAAKVQRSAPAVTAAAASKEPGWVTAVGILAAVVMIWGFMIQYSISQEDNPKSHFFTSAFAGEK